MSCEWKKIEIYVWAQSIKYVLGLPFTWRLVYLSDRCFAFLVGSSLLYLNDIFEQTRIHCSLVYRIRIEWIRWLVAICHMCDIHSHRLPSKWNSKIEETCCNRIITISYLSFDPNGSARQTDGQTWWNWKVINRRRCVTSHRISRTFCICASSNKCLIEYNEEIADTEWIK